MEIFEVQGIKICRDEQDKRKLYGITDEIESLINQMKDKVKTPKNSTLKELNSLIEKYPSIQAFKICLVQLYSNMNLAKKTVEAFNILTNSDPEDVNLKLWLAERYLKEKLYDRIPKILSEEMQINKLYPERDFFYMNEVYDYYMFASQYFMIIKKPQESLKRFNVLIEMKKIIDPSTDTNLVDQMKTLDQVIQTKEKEDLAKAINTNLKVIATKVVEPSKFPPIFENEIIKQLYSNSLRINQDLIQEILNLPRKSLISDLHKVVYDSIARFEYFRDTMSWHPQTHEFIIHALFILSELKDNESFELIFNVLRQDNDYLKFWFNDCMTDVFWPILFDLGYNNLDAFKKFVFEPNRSGKAKSVVTDVVIQIAIYHSERRDEIMNWFRDVIEEILAKKEDDNFIDTKWIGYIVWNLVNISAVELIDLIQKLFEFNLLSNSVCGNFDTVSKNINSDNQNISKIKNFRFNSIFLRYENCLQTWADYYDNSDLRAIDYDDNLSLENDKYVNANQLVRNNGVKNFPKSIDPHYNINRNDPCPCGSGKKYKKCCM